MSTSQVVKRSFDARLGQSMLDVLDNGEGFDDDPEVGRIRSTVRKWEQATAAAKGTEIPPDSASSPVMRITYSGDQEAWRFEAETEPDGEGAGEYTIARANSTGIDQVNVTMRMGGLGVEACRLGANGEGFTERDTIRQRRRA